MESRKFYATSISAAMREVRKALGPDAVILATRSLRPGEGILLSDGRATVEVTASREMPRGSASNADRLLQSASGIGASAPSNKTGTAANPETPTRRAEGSAERFSRAAGLEAYSAAQSATFADANAPRTRTNGERLPARPQPSKDQVPSAVTTLLTEIKALRELLDVPVSRRPPPTRQGESGAETLLSTTSDAAAGNGSVDPFGTSGGEPAVDAVLPARQFQKRLAEQGVDDVLIRRLIDRMHFAAGGDGESRGTFQQFVQVVRGFVPLPSEPKSASGTPRKTALVGPTGVGKTTTLAKIASRLALHENRQVALVTLDTYRIAAADQLRTYARLLGVPLHVVSDYAKLGESFERFADADHILIDTPGHSPRDQAALERLAAAFRQHPDVEIHLLLACATRGNEMRGIMDRFRPIGFDRVVFSKLDEAAAVGDLLNTWVMGGYPASYFTTGQRVPEDLEAAQVDAICRRLLAPVE